MFQDNPVTGALFIAAIGVGPSSASEPGIAAGAVIALVIATTTAILLDADASSLRQGLFGFNGLLVGAAVPIASASTPSMWLLLVVGAAVSTVVMLAIANVMKTWGVPALTFPFVLTTWFLMLAAYSFGTVTFIEGMGPPALAHAAPGPAIRRRHRRGRRHARARGLAQGAGAGVPDRQLGSARLLVLLGLVVVSSLWAAAFALAGSAVALLVSLSSRRGALADISNGLYGFSPVLTAVAVGCVFYKPGPRVVAYALVGTVFTVLVQGAMNMALTPFGLPTLTAPFVLATWLFLLPRLQFK